MLLAEAVMVLSLASSCLHAQLLRAAQLLSLTKAGHGGLGTKLVDHPTWHLNIFLLQRFVYTKGRRFESLHNTLFHLPYTKKSRSVPFAGSPAIAHRLTILCLCRCWEQQ